MGAGDSNASAKLTSLVTALGAVPGIQLNHSGRKGSTDRQWLGGKPLGPEQFGWQVVRPSAIAFNDISPVPAELTIADVDQIVGYLIHQFLSPHGQLRRLVREPRPVRPSRRRRRARRLARRAPTVRPRLSDGLADREV
jgi:hypothetical protein